MSDVGPQVYQPVHVPRLEVELRPQVLDPALVLLDVAPVQRPGHEVCGLQQTAAAAVREERMGEALWG